MHLIIPFLFCLISPILLLDLDQIHESEDIDVHGEIILYVFTYPTVPLRLECKCLILQKSNSILNVNVRVLSLDWVIREINVRVGSDGCSNCNLDIWLKNPEVIISLGTYSPTPHTLRFFFSGALQIDLKNL